MNNQSGKTFEDAKIKLMAGDVNKIPAAAGMGWCQEPYGSYGCNDG